MNLTPWLRAKELAHHVIAIASAVVLVISGGATVVSDLINQFGGNVSATDVTAKTALVSGTLLLLSKLIDSVNNAVTGTTAPASNMRT